jgi:hypothetical protein
MSKQEIALPEPTHPQIVAAASIQQVAADCVVTDADTRQIAATLLQGVVKRKDELVELRFSFTRPLDALKKRAMEVFGAPVERYEAAERTIKGKIAAYDQEQERQRRAQEEAARRAQEEEAERIRKAAEAKAKKTKDPEKKAAILQDAAVQAQNVVAPMPVAPVVASAGVSSRQVWKGKGEDLDATIKAAAAGDTLARACLMFNETVIGQQARSLKDAAKIPGVRIWPESSIAVSRS